jgi:hypothetical protein
LKPSSKTIKGKKASFLQANTKIENKKTLAASANGMKKGKRPA